MTEVWQGPTPRVRFREVSVKREVTGYCFTCMSPLSQMFLCDFTGLHACCMVWIPVFSASIPCCLEALHELSVCTVSTVKYEV